MALNCLRLLLPFLFAAIIKGCDIQGYVYNLTSSFTDLAYPRTLTVDETYYFSGTDCTYPITVVQEVLAGGSLYAASTEVVASAPTPVVVTFHYPSFTMTTLSSINPTIIETWVNLAQGGGHQTIVVPVQTYMSFPTTSTTPTSTQNGPTTSNTEVASSNTTTAAPSSSSSSTAGGRISGGTIGGIVGGIVGGFLILGALTYWWMRRYKRRLLRTVEGPRADSWYMEDSGQFGSVNSSKKETQLPTEETVVENGGRLGKQYYK